MSFKQILKKRNTETILDPLKKKLQVLSWLLFIIVWWLIFVSLFSSWWNGVWNPGPRYISHLLISILLFLVDITISQKSRIFDECTDGVARHICTPLGFHPSYFRGIHIWTCYTEQITIISRQMYKISIKKSFIFFLSSVKMKNLVSFCIQKDTHWRHNNIWLYDFFYFLHTYQKDSNLSLLCKKQI